MIYFNYFTNPFSPNKGMISRVLPGELTISQITKTQNINLSRPTICLVNGAAVLRKDWDTLLRPNSVVSFVALPLGGGGGSSNPLQVVLMVAVVVASVYTGGLVGAAYGTMWGAVAAAGVSIGGGNIQVTELNGFAVNLKMNTPTLIIVHQDVPGMIALVTDILSRYGINIAQMTVTRENAGEKAIMIIEIDSHQCDEAVTEIARIPHLHNVNFFS